MSNTVTRKNRAWVSVGGVAKHYLVSPATVRRWIKGGRLSAIRLPRGHYRITLVDFRDFLERYGMPIMEELFVSKSEKKGGDK